MLNFKKLRIYPLILILFLLSTLLTVRNLYKTVITQAPDFSIFWLSAKDLTHNLNPYLNQKLFTSNPNPPHAHLIFLPLTLLPYQLAQGIFLTVSILSIATSVFLSLKMIQQKISTNTYMLALSLTLISFPAKFTLGMGQTNGIVFLLLLISFYLHQKKNPKLSGMALGIASSIKTTFLFFFLYYLIKKQWKIALWAILTLLVLIIITIAISSPYLYKYWITKAIAPFLGLQGREVYYNQGISGIISRFFNSIITRNYLTAISSMVLVVTTIKTALVKNKQVLQFSLFIITLLLIDSLSWQHHFIWLIFPFITIFYYLTKQKNIKLLLIATLAYILISWNIKNPTKLNNIISLILLSHVFIGTTILFFVNLKLIKKQNRV